MKNTFGSMIASLRKENGMTQLELAEKMNVTDKAVSKWERDLAFPDVQTLPKLAELFGVSVDDLIKARTGENMKENKILKLALKGIAIAMGICVLVLSLLDEIDSDTAISMLSIGLVALSLIALSENKYTLIIEKSIPFSYNILPRRAYGTYTVLQDTL